MSEHFVGAESQTGAEYILISRNEKKIIFTSFANGMTTTSPFKATDQSHWSPKGIFSVNNGAYFSNISLGLNIYEKKQCHY